MSTRAKHKHKTDPEKPDVTKAKETDHLFLLITSPIADVSYPIMINTIVSRDHNNRRLDLSPLNLLRLYLMRSEKNMPVKTFIKAVIVVKMPSGSVGANIYLYSSSS